MYFRRAVWIVGVLLGTVFLYMAGRLLDLATLAESLKRAHAIHVIGVVACMYLSLVVKAHRWRYLIRPITRAPMTELLPAVYAGNAGNLIFPHAGEVLRAVVASRRLNVQASALLASVAVERIFDFLALLLMAFIVLIPVGRMSPHLLAATYVIGALATVFLGLAAMFVIWTERCLDFVNRALAAVSSSVRESVLKQLRAGIAGLNSIAQPELFLPIFLLSVLQWTAVTGCVAFSIEAVDVPVSLASAVAVLMLCVIGLTLPAAPGQVGTVQLAFTVALAQFGVAPADAFAASLIYNFFMVATGLSLGVPSLRRAGVELRRMLEANSSLERRS